MKEDRSMGNTPAGACMCPLSISVLSVFMLAHSPAVVQHTTPAVAQNTPPDVVLHTPPAVLRHTPQAAVHNTPQAVVRHTPQAVVHNTPPAVVQHPPRCGATHTSCCGAQYTSGCGAQYTPRLWGGTHPQLLCAQGTFSSAKKAQQLHISSVPFLSRVLLLPQPCWRCRSSPVIQPQSQER